MPFFENPDWSTYKAALRRIAETGMELERSDRAGAPEAEIVEQQFQAALEAYHQVRAELVTSLAQAGADPGLGPTSESGEGPAPGRSSRPRQQGDEPGRSDQQQG